MVFNNVDHVVAMMTNGKNGNFIIECWKQIIQQTLN